MPAPDSTAMTATPAVTATSPQPASDFDAERFRAQALADGYDEVLQREWAAGAVIDTHTHPFAVRAVVTQGELWLTCGGQTLHLVAGSVFELAHSEPHAERYGPSGATYWVARRSAA